MQKKSDMHDTRNCKNKDCVFCNDDGTCRIPVSKNFVVDYNDEFHCINYLTDIKNVSKEAIAEYGLRKK